MSNEKTEKRLKNIHSYISSVYEQKVEKTKSLDTIIIALCSSSILAVFTALHKIKPMEEIVRDTIFVSSCIATMILLLYTIKYIGQITSFKKFEHTYMDRYQEVKKQFKQSTDFLEVDKSIRQLALDIHENYDNTKTNFRKINISIYTLFILLILSFEFAIFKI